LRKLRNWSRGPIEKKKEMKKRSKAKIDATLAE